MYENKAHRSDGNVKLQATRTQPNHTYFMLHTLEMRIHHVTLDAVTYLFVVSHKIQMPLSFVMQ